MIDEPVITVAGIPTGRMRHLIVDGATACGRPAPSLRGPVTGVWASLDERGRQVVWNCRLCDRAARRDPRRLGLA